MIAVFVGLFVAFCASVSCSIPRTAFSLRFSSLALILGADWCWRSRTRPFVTLIIYCNQLVLFTFDCLVKWKFEVIALIVDLLSVLASLFPRYLIRKLSVYLYIRC